MELRHFRNLGAQELRFPPEGVAIVGDNGQGKTNLLEAIYYLESFRSFRGASDVELAAFSHDVFHIRAHLDNGRTAERTTVVAAGFDKKTRSKKVMVDGDDSGGLAAALGRLGAVVLTPSDAELVSGGPGVRRRFLDIMLCLNRRGYLPALREYRRSLAQRSAALRSAGNGAGGRELVRPWEGRLVENGAVVTRMRAKWTEEFGGRFSRCCEAISGGQAAALSYRASVCAGGGPDPNAAEDVLSDAFRCRLDESWERDVRFGITGVGPHRDELLIAAPASGRALPVRSYGSGGQRRTAALALRLAEAETIRRERGLEPLLLVDDAFAELDERRSERLAELLGSAGSGQVILTVPKDSEARLPGRSLPTWRISEGTIAA